MSTSDGGVPDHSVAETVGTSAMCTEPDQASAVVDDIDGRWATMSIAEAAHAMQQLDVVVSDRRTDPGVVTRAMSLQTRLENRIGALRLAEQHDRARTGTLTRDAGRETLSQGWGL